MVAHWPMRLSPYCLSVLECLPPVTSARDGGSLVLSLMILLPRGKSHSYGYRLQPSSHSVPDRCSVQHVIGLSTQLAATLTWREGPQLTKAHVGQAQGHGGSGPHGLLSRAHGKQETTQQAREQSSMQMALRTPRGGTLGDSAAMRLFCCVWAMRMVVVTKQ